MANEIFISNPLYWIMAGSAAVSFDMARVSWEGRNMLEARRDNNVASNWPDMQWLPIALAINRDDGELYCDHTGEHIPSALW